MFKMRQNAFFSFFNKVLDLKTNNTLDFFVSLI